MFNELGLSEKGVVAEVTAESVPATPIGGGRFCWPGRSGRVGERGKGTVVPAGEVQKVGDRGAPRLPAKGGVCHGNIVQCGYGNERNDNEAAVNGDGS